MDVILRKREATFQPPEGFLLVRSGDPEEERRRGVGLPAKVVIVTGEATGIAEAQRKALEAERTAAGRRRGGYQGRASKPRTPSRRA
jgi:hypothetical protein